VIRGARAEMSAWSGASSACGNMPCDETLEIPMSCHRTASEIALFGDLGLPGWLSSTFCRLRGRLPPPERDGASDDRRGLALSHFVHKVREVAGATCVQEDAMRSHPPRTDALVRRRAGARRTPRGFVGHRSPAAQAARKHPSSTAPRSARSRRAPARIGKIVEMPEQLVVAALFSRTSASVPLRSLRTRACPLSAMNPRSTSSNSRARA